MKYLTFKTMVHSEEKQLELLSNAIAKGDVVVNLKGEEFLILLSDDDNDFQVFVHGNTKLNQGWIKEDGTPEEGCTIGKYYMCDDNGVWNDTDAVWCPNQECLTPYELSDFRFNGSFFEKK